MNSPQQMADCKIKYITSTPQPARRISVTAAPYLPALTGLRFALAMWVILHHLTGKNMLLSGWAATLPDAIQSLLHGGYLAVQTFFVLSGFVLAQSYAHTRWDRKSLMRFAIARFARIYPAYLLSLVVISWFVFQFLLRPESLARKVFALGNYAFVLQGWTGSLRVGWNTPAWSLSCEFFFYLCFPLVFGLLRRKRMAVTLGALGVSFVAPIVLAHSGVPAEWKPIHHLSDFVAGIAGSGIFNAMTRDRRWPGWVGTAVYVSAIVSAVAFIVHPHLLDGTVMSLNTVLRPLNVALLVGLATGGGWIARVLSGRLAGYLGQASYSMYILHIPLLWWYSRYPSYRWGALAPAWTGFLFLAVVVAASIFAFEFVETPSNRWIRDWAASRLEGRPQLEMRAAA